MREISLSRGLVTLVDDEDYDTLSQWKWHVCSRGYAARKVKQEGVGYRQIRILMHMVLLGINVGDRKSVIHRDGNPLNNQKINLKIRAPAAPKQKPLKKVRSAAYRRTYRIWAALKTRCLNSRNKDFGHYGGRGITVCEKWLKFEGFLEDMGEAPDGLTIDRFPDMDGNYEPGNCRWASMKEQNQNRRTSIMLTHAGETKCLTAWAEELAVPVYRLRRLILQAKLPTEVAFAKATSMRTRKQIAQGAGNDSLSF